MKQKIVAIKNLSEMDMTIVPCYGLIIYLSVDIWIATK